jgi:hypothetical protein
MALRPYLNGKMPSRSRTVIPLLLHTVLLAGCGGGQRPGTLPAGGEHQADSAADSAASLSIAAGPQAPASLAGSWGLRADGGTRRGPILELAIDSLAGPTFRVSMAFLMQGNVGIEQSLFEPTRGRVDADGVVYLTVKARAQAEPMGEMSGVLARDTIRLRTYRWAGEDQTAGGTRWLLVKQPS